MTESTQTPRVGNARAPRTSAAETVFDALLQDILSGAYPAGARLPAERELARSLGASRPTLREALRCLAEWRLVEPRRGSGIVVRPQNEWSIEVLPAYLRHAERISGRDSTIGLVRDLLLLRRSLVREVIATTCGRIPPGGSATARAALDQAWEARDQPRRFLSEDFAVIRGLVGAADFWPAVWLLNRLAEVYAEIASAAAGATRPPDDYLEVYGRLFAALEQQDRESAVSIIDGYLERYDRTVMESLS